MEVNRTKNASRNIFFGIILKAYQILIPFFMRTAMIYFMGVQYLGLNSLFVSILQILNLTELGIGSAMVYSMYKPIAQEDTATVCALLNLYKIYYRAIGLIIAIIGIILVPFIPKLIRGDVPIGINIYILYLLNLFATVLSYELFAYKSSLLYAHQRADINSKVVLVTSSIQYICQFFVLWAFQNYYFYVILTILTQILTNILTAIVASKMYPEYQAKGKLKRETVININQRIRDLFTAKLGSVIISSVDTIVISAFLGLTTLAIYQNYYFILNAIYGTILVIFGSITAGIGNSLTTENIDKNFNDMIKFTFLTCWLITVCVCCFAVLYQPFMKLWVGEDLMLDYSFVILFCFLFYVLVLSMVWATIKDAGGIWHSDRFRPLIGALVNFFMNIFLVQFIGLYGIVLSTILSYIFITMPWLVRNLFKYIYKRAMGKYIQKLFYYFLICIISCFLTVLFCDFISLEGIKALFTYAAISVIVPNVVQFLFYNRLPEFEDSKELVIRMIDARRTK